MCIFRHLVKYIFVTLINVSTNVCLFLDKVSNKNLYFIVKSCLQSFSPFPDSRRAVVSYWQKHVHKYWFTAQRTKTAWKSVFRLTD